MGYNPKKYWSQRQQPTKKQELPEGLEFFIGNYVKDANSILDIGCGTGRTFYLYPNQAQVVGLDFVDTYQDQVIEKASKHGFSFIYFRHDINNPLPFPDNHFTHCLVVKVLLHLKDPETAIKEFARVSRNVLISDVWREKEIARHVFLHDYKYLLKEYDVHWYDKYNDHLNIIYSKP